MEEEEARPGREELEGRKEGGEEGQKEEVGVMQGQQKIRSNVGSEGEKALVVAIGNTVSFQTGLLKEQDGGFKKRKKKLDNFQRRNLKCNKSAGGTTKGRG